MKRLMYELVHLPPFGPFAQMKSRPDIMASLTRSGFNMGTPPKSGLFANFKDGALRRVGSKK